MSPSPRSPRKQAPPAAQPRRALGRGLAALMPGPSAGTSPQTGTGGGYRVLSIERLTPNKKQPRKYFEEEALRDLTASIKVQGLLQPIIVRRHEGNYEIVAGERRWRAATRAGLTEVPCIIKDFSDDVALQVALIENIQRHDLDPLEEASAFRQLVTEYKLSHDELAESLGKSRTQITNTMRLLKLPDAVIAMMGSGKLTAGHARALIPLGDTPQTLQLALDLVGRRASVREAESRVNEILKAQKKRAGRVDKPGAAAKSSSADHQAIEERLQRALGTRVKLIAQRGGKGHLEVQYHSLDALDELLDKLCGLG